LTYFHNKLCEYHALYNFLNSKIQKDKMNYILLDEIQVVENFEKVVDSLFINPNVDIYLTCSNATLLFHQAKKHPLQQ